jgi:glycosyltransferase involved in cell wall biosynthesis
MNVLYDHQAFSNQKYGGVSKYFYELMNNTYSTKLCEFEVSLFASDNIYMMNSPFSPRPLNIFLSLDFLGKRRALNNINKIFSIRKIKENDFDLFHPTYYDPYFLKYIKKPFVLTLYDFTQERFSSSFSKIDKTVERKKKLIDVADGMIAISHNTKKDLVELYGVERGKVKVIPLATSIIKKRDLLSFDERFSLPKNFILFVGGRGGYKNFDLFFEAIKPIIQKRNIGLVCVGGGKFNPSERKLILGFGLLKKVHQFDLDDDSLAYFYQRALCFVFPSLYEGFGLPVLEAFACDCPVALSKSSSFPEIAKNAAIYFNPKSKSDIMDKVLGLIEGDALRKKLVKRGHDRLKGFSWKKTSKETVKLYNELV